MINKSNTKSHFYAIVPSPLDDIVVAGDGNCITGVYLKGHKDYQRIKNTGQFSENHFGQAITQLQEYFDGKRRQFDLPLQQPGTVFQQTVWQALLAIPMGDTRSYADICNAIGKPRAFQAVGCANGANKIAIIVPCHRVIGKQGHLTGYAGGLDAKQWLLEHEHS